MTFDRSLNINNYYIGTYIMFLCTVQVITANSDRVQKSNTCMKIMKLETLALKER